MGSGIQSRATTDHAASVSLRNSQTHDCWAVRHQQLPVVLCLCPAGTDCFLGACGEGTRISVKHVYPQIECFMNLDFGLRGWLEPGLRGGRGGRGPCRWGLTPPPGTMTGWDGVLIRSEVECQSSGLFPALSHPPASLPRPPARGPTRLLEQIRGGDSIPGRLWTPANRTVEGPAPSSEE